MEFSFLQKTGPRNKTFVRYAIKSYVASEESSYNRSGFFYIGKNPANIEKLVKIYKRGYASESIEHAKSELFRSLQLEKNNIPEIIFCETQFDAVAIRSFSLYLNNHAAFSSIPFVLDGGDLGEGELGQYRNTRLADEIIFLGRLDDAGLVRKIQFLKKVKTKVAGLETLARTERKFMSGIDTASMLKRAFDIVLSSVALLLLSPIFLLISLAINLESRGPVFYISKRAGRGYRIFNFYKFRTMYTGADKMIGEFSHLNQYNTMDGEGPVFFKISNDPRVTRVGTFLRNTSLDELPQLINVLLGDMSLVGNRPLPLYEAETLTTDECAKRFLAPAGITGLWQIKKRGREDMSVEERISLDIDYANNYNFMYDLWIMANTPSALIQKSSV